MTREEPEPVFDREPVNVDVPTKEEILTFIEENEPISQDGVIHEMYEGDEACPHCGQMSREWREFIEVMYDHIEELLNEREVLIGVEHKLEVRDSS